MRATADVRERGRGYRSPAMKNHDSEHNDGGVADWAAPELVEAVPLRRDDCQRHIAQRVIAALRRGGINCSVVLTDEDERH
jgi:hypothetical protein